MDDPLLKPWPRELASDRLLRHWAHMGLALIGLACLLFASLAWWDGADTRAAAGAWLGLCWILAARILAPM